MKTLLIIFVFIFLLFFQLVYSFLFPAAGSNANWQPVSAYLPKFTAETADSFFLGKIYPFISPDYRLNSDVGNYLELAQNFNSKTFNGHIFVNRPLYPFLIFLSSWPVRLFIEPSYGIIFASAIFLNFILISASVLLFFSLLKELFSLKVAWLSSILLIFSPLVHSFLNQPLAEMLMAFVAVLSAYLIFNYVRKPSARKLVIFSLIIGITMLGKMFFATSFFIIILAVYFKRFKEGAVFLAVHLIPFSFWYLWITKVWRISYFSVEVQNWDMGIWWFNIFHWPWQETALVLLNALPNFINVLIFSFLLIPVIFSALGFQRLPFKAKNIFYFAPFLSVFALGFLIRFYFVRHVFLLFPIVYPTCVLGIERVASLLKRHRQWYSLVFYAIIIGLIIFISNINIYQIFNYLDYDG